MKIRIIAGGIYGADSEIPIGTVIEVKAVPAGWAGRYEVVGKDAAPEAVLVAASAEEITTAVSMLDATDDAHWTAAGLPAVDAVAELTGKAVTRKAIEEAAPDAKRPE